MWSGDISHNSTSLDTFSGSKFPYITLKMAEPEPGGSQPHLRPGLDPLPDGYSTFFC